MGKRLELRGDQVWLVVGKDLRNSARHFILRECEDSTALDGYNVWNECNNPTAEFKVNDVAKIVNLAEKWNEWQGERGEHVDVPEDVKAVAHEQVARRKAERERKQAEYRAKQALEEERRQVWLERYRAEKERDAEVIWKDRTRGELRTLIRFGLLAETVETKTLYEMYADGVL